MQTLVNQTFNFVKSASPAEVLQKPVTEIIGQLERMLGRALTNALDPAAAVPGPFATENGTRWLKTANTVGINVRTIRHFWNIIPYSLLLPNAQNAIHILPIWETGVVSSLYGPSSWNINPEFFSPELAAAAPQLDSVEKQLKAVVNLLHLLGKAVGMDVVPHTDRYSEQALANPQFFEWLQRRDLEIVRHSGDLHHDVQMSILGWLLEQGSAVAGLDIPHEPDVFFTHMSEPERLQRLFGTPQDYSGRLRRRKMLMQQLYEEGFETVPATMGPPYRGLEVNPDAEAVLRDEDGRVWRDYRIKNAQSFSRVFGPLARYRLYEARNNNNNWELDFEKPNRAAWTYVCEHYRHIQARYNFDFMRGDMSHVQMRREGVPKNPDEYYDLHRAVKLHICKTNPSFGYFAESFLAPPGEMAYGDECDHLEASLADSTLGDLQSEPVGTVKFVRDFWQYRDWLETRRFAPNFTIFTADKDDPRFDRFYLQGNELRHFMALFLADMPSYMGLGFECRDPHPTPAANEFYTKLYVFQESSGPKSTSGPYRWGTNVRLYNNILRQRILADRIFPNIQGVKTDWLIPPDRSGRKKMIAWTQAGTPSYIFIANLDTGKACANLKLDLPAGTWALNFSTEQATLSSHQFSGGRGLLKKILPGEGLVLELLPIPDNEAAGFPKP
ncbi:MAG: hypothetical protein L6Q97_10185 [Thermoanaerobaculia bacterium]|nr:hypothetical protein [Thermoanaerobaculia bacterium]